MGDILIKQNITGIASPCIFLIGFDYFMEYKTHGFGVDLLVLCNIDTELNF